MRNVSAECLGRRGKGICTVAGLDGERNADVGGEVPFPVLPRRPLAGESCAAEGFCVKGSVESGVVVFAVEEGLLAISKPPHP